MLFAGYDHSLTAPGICILDVDANVHVLKSVRTGSRRGMERVSFIVDAVTDAFRDVPVAHCEGYAYNQATRGQNATIEALGIIKWELHKRGVRMFQKATPTTLKKYLTGYGRAEKEAVIAAVRQRGIKCLDDNQADAYGLAIMLRDAWLWDRRGVRPATLYQFDQVKALASLLREAVSGSDG